MRGGEVGETRGGGGLEWARGACGGGERLGEMTKKGEECGGRGKAVGRGGGWGREGREGTGRWWGPGGEGEEGWRRGVGGDEGTQKGGDGRVGLQLLARECCRVSGK